MTRRRRAPGRLADMSDERRAAYIVDALLDPSIAPNLKAEVDALESTGLLWLDLLPELVRRDDPDLNAAVDELLDIRNRPERPYDPNCFKNPNCDCSACVEMRQTEAAELQPERTA